MAKKQSSKTTGGTQKFGKKAAPKTYDADKKKAKCTRMLVTIELLKGLDKE